MKVNTIEDRQNNLEINRSTFHPKNAVAVIILITVIVIIIITIVIIIIIIREVVINNVSQESILCVCVFIQQLHQDNMSMLQFKPDETGSTQNSHTDSAIAGQQ